MTKYFAGNSLAAFKRTTAAITDGDTTSGRFDTAYVSSAIHIGAGSTGQYIETPPFSATGSFWLRYDIYQGGNPSASTDSFMEMYNGATPVFRFRTTIVSYLVTPQYWTAGAWASAGSTFTLANSALTTLVIRIDLNSGFEVFMNNTSVASGTGWSGGQTTITAVRLFPGNTATASTTATRVSQIMGANYDIRDTHLMASALNGNSAANTGASSGVYTDVNEGVLNDATAIAISTSANKAGQTHAGITLPGGYVIAAAVVAARGRHDGVISDGKLGIRSAGTNYSSSGKSYAAGYEPRLHIVDNNPATSAPFTQGGFNGVEPYLEAA
jgi:hypothetical protein